MEALGKQDLARDGLVSALSPLVTGYREWLALQEERIATDAEVGLYKPSGTRALRDAHDMADRLERAIQLLHDNGLAREAFRFANQAMALQRVRSELVRARAADPDAKTAALLRKLNRPENRSWRPFQLAFPPPLSTGADQPSTQMLIGASMTVKFSCSSSPPVAARPKRIWV
ncbi:hypothetical protein STENM327S_07613 [Streptomyces tendae]